MGGYSLSLPSRLKAEAEELAARLGISLDQFILSSVAEKVGSLWDSLDDPAFAQVTYRRGTVGQPVPVLRGTGIRVQTVVVAGRQWGMDTRQIATEFGLTEAQVKEAVAFYGAHQAEIDAALAAEQALEASHDPA